MTWTLAGLIMASSGAAWAHPGERHGGVGDALLHLMSEPDHIALLIAAAVIGGLGSLIVCRRTMIPRTLKS